MATKDMAIVLGGSLLPKPSSFKEIIEENSTDRRTLGGTQFTDFINQLRSWEIGWDLIESEDYDVIRTIYNNQFDAATYPYLQFNAYSIYVPVKVEISSRQIKYNGSLIEGFKIILKEQYAIS